MSSKAYTYAQRIAAAFLARLNGSEAAATAFGIDPRTVRSWQDTVPVPDDAWTAIRDVLLARGAEMAATGKTTGLAAVLTGAGISDRNVRYGQLIARREARRTEDEAPPEPNLIREQLDRLDPRRKRLLADELRHALRRRESGLDDSPPPGPEQESDLPAIASLVEELLARSDDDVDARSAALDDERRELDRLQFEAAEAEQAPRMAPSGPDADPADEPTRLPTPRVARPTPLPKVIDTGYAPSTWHELERRDRP